jgi:hypothetical protein
MGKSVFDSWLHSTFVLAFSDTQSPSIMSLFRNLVISTALFIALSSCEQQIDRSFEEDKVEGSLKSNNAATKPNTNQKTVSNDESEEAATVLEPERSKGKQWRQLAGFKGKKNQKTVGFKIKNAKWQIRWNVESDGKDDAEFLVIMHNLNDPEDSEFVAQQVGAGEGFTDFEGGKGEYYLDITSAQPYSIVIEEYK